MKSKNFLIIALIFIIPLFAYMFLSHSEMSAAKKNENTNKPKIIKFTSLMCLDCKKLSTEMKEVYPKYSNKITLIEIQVQNNDEFTKSQIDKYHISLVPTLILLNKQGKKVKKIEGFVDKKELNKIMKDLANE